MDKKVYVITIKESGKLTSYYEAYDTFDKAVKRLKTTCKKFDRQLRETELRNEFRVYTSAGDFIHTLKIVDLWLR